VVPVETLKHEIALVVRESHEPEEISAPKLEKLCRRDPFCEGAQDATLLRARASQVRGLLGGASDQVRPPEALALRLRPEVRRKRASRPYRR
jgi:hypothetical protein